MPALSRHFALCIFSKVRRDLIAQMISMANTKNVNTNGITSVSQGQCVAMVRISTATETKNKIQYKFLFLLCNSIWKNFGKNRRGAEISKDIF